MIKYKIVLDIVNIEFIQPNDSIWFRYIGAKEIQGALIEAEVYNNIQLDVEEVSEESIIEYIKQNADIEKIEKEVEEKLKSFEITN